ncbi:MAG TPA: tetratricopeptide repeat protein, partial [Gemmataceae bacterium]|nr:tetratricopeptide repeat protein [Gemmataceae bacterium]
VMLVAVAPDGHRLVTASEDGTVKHWRAATDEEARAPRTELDPNDPVSPAALAAAADILSQNSRWAEAETTYQNALKRLEKLAAAFPDVTGYRLQQALNWYRCALVQLGTGDLAGYRKSCAAMLEHFSQTGEPEMANWVAWTCALAPESVKDLGACVRLADKAVAGNPKDGKYLGTLGAVLYRAGRYEDALPRLSGGIGVNSDQMVFATAYDCFFLAMAHHRLGHADEARRCFDLALRSMKPLGQNAPSWNRRLTLELLRREAEDLVKGKQADAAGCRATAELWEKLKQTDGRSLYDAACYRAVAAAVIGATDKSEGAAQKVEAEAARAMTWLKQAIAAGFDDVAHMKQDKDLDALRGREDFKKVVADLDEKALNDPQRRIERGRMYAKTGRFDEAAADFAKALSQLPGSENLIPDPEILCWPNRAGIDEAVVERDEVFNAVVKLRPNDAQLWAARAYHSSRRGQWQQAATAMAKVNELAPSVHHGWYLNAPLCLKVGDLEGYRRTCREMLTRSARTKNPYMAERTAKTCSLIPNAVSDRELVTKLADQAVSGTEKHGGYVWFVLAKGMTDYRDGRFTTAITWLGKSLSLDRENPEVPERDALAHLFLAMTHHQLGRPDEARQALDKARKMTEAIAREPDNQFYDWLRVHIVRREAEALVRRSEADQEKAKEKEKPHAEAPVR